jgi:hypothetical protein
MTKIAGCFVAMLAACGGNAGGPGPPPGDQSTPVNTIAFNEWKTTMTIADFHTAGMAVAWSTMKSDDGKLCTSCHTEYGSADEPYFFSQVVMDEEILTRFFAAANGKISINAASFNAAATHTDPAPSDHPPFDPSTAIGVTALDQFYSLTCAHMASLCP